MSAVSAEPDLLDRQDRLHPIAGPQRTAVAEPLVAVHHPAQRQAQFRVGEHGSQAAAAITAANVGGAIGWSPKYAGFSSPRARANSAILAADTSYAAVAG